MSTPPQVSFVLLFLKAYDFHSTQFLYLSFQSSYYVPCNGLLGLPFKNNKSLYRESLILYLFSQVSASPVL